MTSRTLPTPSSTSEPSPPRHRVRRRSFLAGFVAGCGAALLVAAGLWWWPRFSPQAPLRTARIEILDPLPAAPLPAPEAPAEAAVLPDGGSEASPPVPPPRGVILVVADGMGLAQASAARIALRGPDGRLAFERFPSLALLTTHAADDLITSSDAAATALATGHKTANGRISLDATGTPLRTLFAAAAAAGWSTGAVTDTAIVDATPAAFTSQVASRYDYQEIAQQQVAGDTTVLIGGGRDAFLPADGGGRREDGRDLLAEARTRGFVVATSHEELARAVANPRTHRLLAPIAAVELAPAEGELAELAIAALTVLSRRDQPFLLLVESERPDTASHRRDGAELVRAVADVDRTVSRLLAATDPGSTLLLVTGDHETGGLAIDHQTAPPAAGARPGLALAWTGARHSGTPVPLWATGPGAEQFRGLLDNTEVARRLAALLTLDAPSRAP
jgi:alkaline phosphatase